MKLGNYKIKVTTESESDEVCNMLEQLGFKIYGFDGSCVPCTIATWDGYYSDYKFNGLNNAKLRQELILPQLRDLVVLHRNDVSDATHARSDGGMFGYLSSDNIEYTWSFATENWYVDSICFSVSDIKPIQSEQGLISGADALRALADGKEVEYSYVGDWFDIDLKTGLGIFRRTDVAFRLKPSTITLNIEIPAPFEPKDGEYCYIISDQAQDGWIKTKHDNDFTYAFGAWRTEEEIKQVVAALRGALKNG